MHTPLKNKRQGCNLTQQELSNAAKRPIRTYQRYEKGERAPDVHTAILIANKLGTQTYQEFTDLFPLPREVN